MLFLCYCPSPSPSSFRAFAFVRSVAWTHIMHGRKGRRKSQNEFLSRRRGALLNLFPSWLHKREAYFANFNEITSRSLNVLPVAKFCQARLHRYECELSRFKSRHGGDRGGGGFSRSRCRNASSAAGFHTSPRGRFLRSICGMYSAVHISL